MSDLEQRWIEANRAGNALCYKAWLEAKVEELSANVAMDLVAINADLEAKVEALEGALRLIATSGLEPIDDAYRRIAREALTGGE